MKKETVVFDFDGVIHSYESPWQGASVIPDAPVFGIREAIADIRKLYKVVVVSTRCIVPEGMKAVKDYLEENGIEVDAIMAEKPPAVVYIDDRAICFDGKPSKLLRKITNFVPWNKDCISSLKPCPFCGRVPEIRRYNSEPSDFSHKTRRDEYVVDVELTCEKCGIRMRDSVVFTIDNETGHPVVVSDGYEELVRWWNKRAGVANESAE